MEMAMTNSAAVGLAVDHCEGWSNHDWDESREALADDVKVTAMTTMLGAPKTDLDGPDAYMEGLRERPLLRLRMAPGAPHSPRVAEEVPRDRTGFAHRPSRDVRSGQQCQASSETSA
jgi:hypothetical protein